jgi:peroxiredoxin
MLILTIWHIYGKCFISDIEKYLKDETTTNEDYVINLFSIALGKHTRQIISTVPLLNTAVCLYKINNSKF